MHRPTDRPTLFSDLKLLGAASHDGLQHLMWTDVCLEVAWVPQLANEFTKSLNKDEHLVARSTTDSGVVVFTQEIVTDRSDV